MRAIVIILACLIPWATLDVTPEIDAQGCRPSVVAIQSHDLVAEPADFDTPQTNHRVALVAITTTTTSFGVRASLHQPESRTREARQHQPPLYKLDVVFLI